MKESNSSDKEATLKMEEELEIPIPEYDGSQQLFRDPFWKRQITIYV